MSGDMLTFPLGDHIRLIRIAALGTRRGPAPEAQALYADLDPPQPKPRDMSAPQRVGQRPTKRARRIMDAGRARDLE
jgi:ribosome-associated heat shock protein Hsp15